MTTLPEEIRQLHWQCRRGVLELDLILRDFVDRRYGALSAEQRTAFRRLLAVPDTQLHDWLLGAADIPDHELNELIKEIR